MSGPIAANSEYCLEFWYHMFGPDIDALNIYLSSAGTSTVVSVLNFKLDSFILFGQSIATRLYYKSLSLSKLVSWILIEWSIATSVCYINLYCMAHIKPFAVRSGMQLGPS